eukprot:GHVT01077898.1.p2 GENE.GHVT01077898.1~~GHVT01077898.1.p2  ORF type:complete len:141 (-),score=12.25 GHVT01077898.1:334-756(-)
MKPCDYHKKLVLLLFYPHSRSGRKTRLAEVLAGDETGCIIITLRDEQVDLCQPGATVVVRNGYVHMFDQHMRLGVDKWGKIAAADEPADFQIDTTINMSDQEYQLISVGGSARGGRGGFPRGRGGMRGNFRGGNQAKNNF